MGKAIILLVFWFNSLLWKRRVREDFLFYFKSPSIPLFLRGKINNKLRMNGLVLLLIGDIVMVS
jgi:hypothetical protein